MEETSYLNEGEIFCVPATEDGGFDVVSSGVRALVQFSDFNLRFQGG